MNATEPVALSPEVLGARVIEIRRRLEAISKNPRGVTDQTRRAYFNLYQHDVRLLLDAVENGIVPAYPKKPSKAKADLDEIDREIEAAMAE